MRNIMNLARRFFYIPLLAGAYFIPGNSTLTQFAVAMLFGMLFFDLYIEMKKRMPRQP